jgi:ABC-type Mn2+/Zn2+ transport system ATPase subunit
VSEGSARLSFSSARIGIGGLLLIDDLNLTLSKGERLLLLGPNGSGKSTLLSVILGNRKVQAGRFTSSFSRIGYVPQWKKVEFQYPLTVERLLSLAFPLPAFSRTEKKRRIEKIEYMLSKVQMDDRRHRLLRECSGGELQRAFLARAFLLNPDLLILDEPISAVDQEGRNQILELLRRYCEEHNPAVILTIHDSEPDWQKFFTRKAYISGHRLNEGPLNEGLPYQSRLA